MSGQTHIIGQEIISLSYKGAKSEATALHEEMSELFSQRLIHELEEVLDSFTNPDTHILIDQLEIDLGRFVREGLEEKISVRWKEIIKAQIEKQIEDHFSVNSSEEVEIVPTEHRNGKQLLYFLAFGSFPWWASKKSLAESRSEWLEWVKTAPGAENSILEVFRNHPEAVKRWAYQFTDTFKEEVLRKINQELLQNARLWQKYWLICRELAGTDLFPEKEWTDAFVQTFWKKLSENKRIPLSEFTPALLRQIVSKNKREEKTYLTHLIQASQKYPASIADDGFLKSWDQAVKQYVDKQTSFAYSDLYYSHIVSQVIDEERVDAKVLEEIERLSKAILDNEEWNGNLEEQPKDKLEKPVERDASENQLQAQNVDKLAKDDAEPYSIEETGEPRTEKRLESSGSEDHSAHKEAYREMDSEGVEMKKLPLSDENRNTEREEDPKQLQGDEQVMPSLEEEKSMGQKEIPTEQILIESELGLAKESNATEEQEIEVLKTPTERKDHPTGESADQIQQKSEGEQDWDGNQKGKFQKQEVSQVNQEGDRKEEGITQKDKENPSQELALPHELAGQEKVPFVKWEQEEPNEERTKPRSEEKDQRRPTHTGEKTPFVQFEREHETESLEGDLEIPSEKRLPFVQLEKEANTKNAPSVEESLTYEKKEEREPKNEASNLLEEFDQSKESRREVEKKQEVNTPEVQASDPESITNRQEERPRNIHQDKQLDSTSFTESSDKTGEGEKALNLSSSADQQNKEHIEEEGKSVDSKINTPQNEYADAHSREHNPNLEETSADEREEKQDEEGKVEKRQDLNPELLKEQRENRQRQNKKIQKPSEWKKKNKVEKKEWTKALESGLYIDNAGLVLIHPFLPAFFEALGLVQGKEFVDEEAREKAVLILGYIVLGELELPEFSLTLNKLLCGMPLDTAIRSDLPLSISEKAEVRSLLEAVIEHWGAMGQASIDGLRVNFLQREGRLSSKDNDWQLKIDHKSYDILLGKLPWGIGMIKLPWMEKLLHVEWGH